MGLFFKSIPSHLGSNGVRPPNKIFPIISTQSQTDLATAIYIQNFLIFNQQQTSPSVHLLPLLLTSGIFHFLFNNWHNLIYFVSSHFSVRESAIIIELSITSKKTFSKESERSSHSVVQVMIQPSLDSCCIKDYQVCYLSRIYMAQIHFVHPISQFFFFNAHVPGHIICIYLCVSLYYHYFYFHAFVFNIFLLLAHRLFPLSPSHLTKPI